MKMEQYLKENKLNKKDCFFAVKKQYQNPTETHYYLYKAMYKECEDFIEKEKRKIFLTGIPTFEIVFDKR
eukprot:SAG11_NODE_3573_length_2359_cov_145.957522_6_plen_70_part_00